MRIGIALGSNVGDRLRHLRRAVRLMLERLPRAQLLAVAPVFETEPVNCRAGSGSFLNSVVEIECGASPHEALVMLRRIENDLGRPTDHPPHAPRTIDLDILYAGDLVVNDDGLTVPHPRITERRFVLQPLAEIAPHLRLPGQVRTIAELLAGFESGEPEGRLVIRRWLPKRPGWSEGSGRSSSRSRGRD